MKVEIKRDPNSWLFRWVAETIDSRGHRAIGLGFTKRGAISDLKSRLRARDKFWNRKPDELIETREVDL